MIVNPAVCYPLLIACRLTYIFGDKAGQFCFAAYRNLDAPCDYCLVVDVLKDGKTRKGMQDIRLENGDILIVEYSSAPL